MAMRRFRNPNADQTGRAMDLRGQHRCDMLRDALRGRIHLGGKWLQVIKAPPLPRRDNRPQLCFEHVKIHDGFKGVELR